MRANATGRPGDAEPVRRQALAVNGGGLAELRIVAVALEVEIELAVGVAERVGIDRAAELALADERLGGLGDEGPARIGAGRRADALQAARPLLGGEIEDEAVADRDHLRRPGEAAPRPGGQDRQRVVQPVAVAQQSPVDEVGGDRHLDVGPAALGVGRVGQELAAMRQDEGIGKVGLEHRHEQGRGRGRHCGDRQSEERQETNQDLHERSIRDAAAAAFGARQGCAYYHINRADKEGRFARRRGDRDETRHAARRRDARKFRDAAGWREGGGDHAGPRERRGGADHHLWRVDPVALGARPRGPARPTSRSAMPISAPISTIRNISARPSGGSPTGSRAAASSSTAGPMRCRSTMASIRSTAARTASTRRTGR